MREQEEKFQQDRLGNVRRELDPIRGQDGKELNRGGLVEVADGEQNTMHVILEIDDEMGAVNVEELTAHNASTAAGTYQLYSATLNDDGTINTTSARSVGIAVGGGVTRPMGYTGRPFNQDAIVVEPTFFGEIGIGFYPHNPEEVEPASEF